MVLTTAHILYKVYPATFYLTNQEHVLLINWSYLEAEQGQQDLQRGQSTVIFEEVARLEEKALKVTNSTQFRICSFTCITVISRLYNVLFDYRTRNP